MRKPCLAALAAVTLLAGCGQTGLTPNALRGPMSGMRGLADEPMIDRQIDEATIRKTDLGTLVRKLPQPNQTRAVTFMTYKGLDNSLTLTMAQHLNILERVGSSSRLNLLALVDDAGPANTMSYYVREDDDDWVVSSPYKPAVERGDLNMAHADNLRLWLKWGIESYPSAFRWVDINSHGGGAFGIVEDYRKGEKTFMPLPELARGMRLANHGKPIDLLSFDACLMATAEVAYELRDVAKVMVASEDSSYALGMNYDQTLKGIEAAPPTDPAALARELVVKAERTGDMKALYTISATDLTKADRIAKSVDELAGALLAAEPQHKPAIKAAMQAMKGFHVAAGEDGNHRDLFGFTLKLRKLVPDAGVAKACLGVREALFGREKAIIITKAAKEEAGAASGMSIFLPADGQVPAIYRDTALAKDTRWDEFLASMAP